MPFAGKKQAKLTGINIFESNESSEVVSGDKVW